MKKLVILDITNYSHLTVEHTMIGYIDIEPKQWIKDTIHDFILKNKLFSENLEIIYQLKRKKYNIIDTETKVTEYLSNIVNH